MATGTCLIPVGYEDCVEEAPLVRETSEIADEGEEIEALVQIMALED